MQTAPTSELKLFGLFENDREAGGDVNFSFKKYDGEAKA